MVKKNCEGLVKSTFGTYLLLYADALGFYVKCFKMVINCKRDACRKIDFSHLKWPSREYFQRSTRT